MGYFVAAHVVRSAPAAESFDVLPASMDWAAYHEPATGAILIDVFGSSVDQSSPFARLPRSPDIAQDLPDTLALYEALLAQRRAGPFRRKYINLNLLFSRATDMSEGFTATHCSLAPNSAWMRLWPSRAAQPVPGARLLQAGKAAS